MHPLRESIMTPIQRVVPWPVDLAGAPPEALAMYRAWSLAYMDDADVAGMWVPIGRVGPMVMLGHSNPAEAATPAYPLWAFGLARISEAVHARISQQVVAALESTDLQAYEFEAPAKFEPPPPNSSQARRNALQLMLAFPGAGRDVEAVQKALETRTGDQDGLPSELPRGWREAAIAIADSLPVVDLSGFLPRHDVAALIPEKFGRDNDLVPIALEGSVMTVASPVIPKGLRANQIHSSWKASRDSAAGHISLQLVLCMAGSRADLDRRVAARSVVPQAAAAVRHQRGVVTSDNVRARITLVKRDLERLRLTDAVEESRLLDFMLYKAIEAGASDLHIDRVGSTGRARLRVDGVLHPLDQGSFAIARLPSLMQLLRVNVSKGGGDLDAIDGKFTLRLDDKLYDVRVSCMPDGDEGVNGVGFAVLRFLPKDGNVRTLTELQLPKPDLTVLMDTLDQPDGLVLVTGPTGSGKTTTLNALLQQLNHGLRPGEDGQLKIVTIEDPVEYSIDGVQQVSVSKQISFAEAVRRFLRQDPDVILIGETRDEETAKAAIDAARTGHLVFSTLHTNGAAETIGRLLGMGIARKELSSVLRTIVAQRLMPTLCPNCKVPRAPTAEESLLFSGNHPVLQVPTTIYDANPNGCANCRRGFKGRIPVLEIVKLLKPIQKIIGDGQDELAIQDACLQAGFLPLHSQALLKVSDGIASLQTAIGLRSGWGD